MKAYEDTAGYMTLDEEAPSRRKTRAVRIGDVTVGGGALVQVQSMCATRTRDIDATVAQVEQLARAGAAIVRVAVDSEQDAAALEEIRAQTDVPLAVDLQENYRLAAKLAPWVDKIRYNPGHLHHHERSRPVGEKVAWLAAIARDNDCAVRIGVNCGSIAPEYLERYQDDRVEAIVQSAVAHAALLEDEGFDRYVVSLKDSDPGRVVAANVRFAAACPEVPLHLGVTEAGLPPDGVIKTRLALEQLLARGIGETIRVSLTLPNDRKHEEVEVGYRILDDVANGRFISVPSFGRGLNIIACPSCSRVENEAFVGLAEQVREITAYAREQPVTIAVMGCRVNGPGETDDADLGLWCGPTTVNLKRKDVTLGRFSYAEVLPRLKQELDRLIATRAAEHPGVGGPRGR
jgi:(E)-4-hydroxy-3-methylbut-2-enyl-diphosphate synthase